MASNKAWKILLYSEDDDDYIMILDILSNLPGRAVTLDWKGRNGDTVEQMCANVYDAILIDHDLHASNALDLVDRFHHVCPEIPLVLASDWPDFDSVLHRGMELGAAVVLQKSGVTSHMLIQVLENLIS